MPGNTSPHTSQRVVRATPDLRCQIVDAGRRWSGALCELVRLAVDLDESGDWAIDGAPTCAHWIAGAVDCDVSTAREWLRVGRALRALPKLGAAFAAGELSYSKARAVTRIASVEHEEELLELAATTPMSRLRLALAAWLASHEDDDDRDRRHRCDRWLQWRTDPDGMVTVTARLTPEQAATFCAAIEAEVMRGDGRDDASLPTKRGGGASRTRRGHSRWLSLGQQRADALISLISGGGTTATTEVIFHVRGDGCTLDDGTPITGSTLERIVDTSVVRAMIHDAEGRPINASSKQRHPTTRQKRVVKERDGRCVDCGSTDLLQFDHEPAYDDSRRTVVDELRQRCAACHRARHANESG